MAFIYRTFILSVFFIFIFLPGSTQIKSQEKDPTVQNKKLEVNANIDMYYAFDSDKLNNPRLYPAVSPFINEFRLNMAQVSLTYNDEKTRGVFTLHFGDIPEINWKPQTKFEFIQEANIGFSPVKNLWFDAGFFQSHIGIEGWPADNFFSSNALLSTFEPNIQSGIRILYDFLDNFSAGFNIINGSAIFEDNNKNKSVGLQIKYNFSPAFQLNYNNIIGNEMPTGTTGKVRYLHNLIATGILCKKVEYQANFDLGSQEKSKLTDSGSTAYLYGGLLSLRYRFNSRISASLRGEFYQDLDGVLSGIVNGKTGVKGNGITLGIEYKPIEKSYVRIEYAYLRLDEAQRVFYDNSNQRHQVTLSFGMMY